jgi:hypothetical protein
MIVSLRPISELKVKHGFLDEQTRLTGVIKAFVDSHPFSMPTTHPPSGKNTASKAEQHVYIVGRSEVTFVTNGVPGTLCYEVATSRRARWTHSLSLLLG